MKTDSKSRKNKILEIIIRNYIETVHPVSSRAVCRKARLNLSPATVRNVMADLEDLGYITHPHTSSGRMPTDKGYRFYVNSLMEKETLSQKDIETIDFIYKKGWNDMDELMSLTAKALSYITYKTAIVLCPRLKEFNLQRIELVPLDAHRLLVNLLVSSGILKSYIVELDTAFNFDEIRRISNFLNGNCAGMTLESMYDFLNRGLITYRDNLFYLCKEAQEILSLSTKIGKTAKLYLEGASYILEQPEFSQPKKAKEILHILEDKERLIETIYENTKSEGIRIYIGAENIFDEMKECTIITSSYKMGQSTSGVLGVIGPTRLEYPKMASAVNYICNRLTKFLS